MSKDQIVKDDKVYEVDTDKGTVKEVGTVTPKDDGPVRGLLNEFFSIGEGVVRGAIDILPGGEPKK
jgi:hypothetical protein